MADGRPLLAAVHEEAEQADAAQEQRQRGRDRGGIDERGCTEPRVVLPELSSSDNLTV